MDGPIQIVQILLYLFFGIPSRACISVAGKIIRSIGRLGGSVVVVITVTGVAGWLLGYLRGTFEDRTLGYEFLEVGVGIGIIAILNGISSGCSNRSYIRKKERKNIQYDYIIILLYYIILSYLMLCYLICMYVEDRLTLDIPNSE